MSQHLEANVLIHPMTKFITPRNSFDLVRRQRLLEQLKTSLKYPFVLIVTPTGYGKTVFLAESLPRLVSRIAWISLDANDDSLDDFWRTVIAGVCRAMPAIDDGLIDLIDTESDSQSAVQPILINEIIRSAPDLCIVLDDYQFITDPNIHNSVSLFFKYFPPNAHLLICSRTRPPLVFHQIMSKGYLTEIGQNDLIFTEAEIKELYNEKLALATSDETIAKINMRLEGWAAGLKMMAIALKSGMSAETVLTSTAWPHKGIMSYLATEVVGQQEAPLREFLLMASRFNEFTASLCDHVYHRRDSQTMIDSAIANNLFLQPVPGRPKWYRFSPFFRQCLVDMREAMLSNDIHLPHDRASKWYEEHGLLADALEQAMEAGAYERAIDLLEETYFQMMGKDESIRILDLVRKFPNSITDSSLWTLISALVSCEMKRVYDEQAIFIKRALYLTNNISSSEPNAVSNSPTLTGSVFTLKILNAYHQGNFSEALDLGSEGLASMPEDESFGRCSILCVVGMANWRIGNIREARQFFHEAANQALPSAWPFSVGLTVFGEAHASFILGNQVEADETCQQLFAFSSQSAQPIFSDCYAHLLHARILYERNVLDEAEDELKAILLRLDEKPEPSLEMNCRMALARVKLAQGEDKRAIKLANCSLAMFEATCPQRHFEDVDIIMAQLWLQNGTPQCASDFLDRFRSFDPTAPLESDMLSQVIINDVFGADFRNVWREAPFFVYARYCLASNRTIGLGKWLSSIQKTLEDTGCFFYLIQVLKLRALIADAAGDSEKAVACFMQAVSLAEREGYVRTFVDEGERMHKLLLKAERTGVSSKFVNHVACLFHLSLTTIDTMPVNDFGESLTKREREIARLLCNGATNDDIAKKLFLSCSTIKNHIHSIYTKLGTKNRAQAIVRMQELGLVDMLRV